MTETAGLVGGDQRLIVERRYQAAPPIGLEIVEPGETFATTKEEEWVSKKKTEVTNTKQIETRVKRQVVLEDGKVVEDSGPVVTTNTTEDTETQEHHQTELRKLGDEDEQNNNGKQLEGAKEDWIATPNPEGVVREVKEQKILSREETEETRETEDVQHLGDITDEDFLAAVQTGKSDLRPILKTKKSDESVVVSTGPRVINEKYKSNKVTDTEETRQLSSVLPDGRIVTETKRTTEHEVVKEDELPDGVDDQNEHREGHQRLLKTRDQHDVDYIADGVKVGHEMRFRSENLEVEKRGDGIDEPDWDSLSARARRRQQNLNRPNRLKENGILQTTSPLDRKDALTRKPLDFDQEEETRKVETSKWLENHFGSESRSSRDSLDDLDDEIEFEKQSQTKTSFFNVTIKSQPSLLRPQEETQRYSPPEKDYSSRQTKYFQGISEWSQRDYNNRERPTQPSPQPIRDRFRVSPPQDYNKVTQDYNKVTQDYNKLTQDYNKVAQTPPSERRHYEKPQRLVREEDASYHRASSRNGILEPQEEPPPDYSPRISRATTPAKKPHQKTRFAADPPPAKPKTGNIIGQSIRKLVGKIRSASAERKAKQQAHQRAKRSPSPSYKQGNIIDANLHQEPVKIKNVPMENGVGRRGESPGPMHRYYLGEDPFGGSIYGRENKYDGVRPTRPSRKNDVRYVREPEEYRSHSTLGRLGKTHKSEQQTASQTLPRHSSTRHEHPTRLDSTINVSFINTVSTPPPKPVRTYHSNLARSKSFNIDLESPFMMQRNVLQDLKSPRLISSISRSQRDLTNDGTDNERGTSRFAKNGFSDKRIFAKDKRTPELFRTLREETGYNGDVYETPTRLRRSSDKDNYSETYHTTTRNDNDPLRPTVTDTVKSFSKKTVPVRDGKGYQTIESTETKSVTKSRYPMERKLNGSVTRGPVVIEVRNYK